jgi:hypothetical protein
MLLYSITEQLDSFFMKKIDGQRLKQFEIEIPIPNENQINKIVKKGRLIPRKNL